MEVGLVIAMFVCNALALNFMVNGKHKLSGTFNIINFFTYSISFNIVKINFP